MKEIDQLNQATSMWGDKEGKIRRAVENRVHDIKKLRHKFHHLKYD